MSESTEKLVKSLGAIAGEANVSAEPGAIEAYAVDAQKPSVVVRPGGADEIAEILRLCAAEKLAVIAAGSGTKLRMGAPPARYDVALVTSRMNRVHGYDPGDLTLSVEPGARMTALATQLAEHKQFLPLSVPFEVRATIGGTVASGVDSPLRQSYGTTRDFLLGAEFVTGGGNRAKSGGRVVKNVAGYDLHKLFIGSLGTLGVVTRLNFKTFPLPEASRGFLASFEAQTGALDLLRRIGESPLEPATLEILSPSLTAVLARRSAAEETAPALPESWFPSSAWVVAAGFGGSEPVLRRYGEELGRMAAEAGATNTATLDDGTRPAVWERLREAIPLLLEASPAATIVRAGVLPNRMGEILTAAGRSAERQELPVAILARAAGAVYVALLPERAHQDELGRIGRAAAALTEATVAARGFSSIPWRPAALNGRLPVWGPGRPDFALMRKVKQVFDPEGILSPGRFVGGL
jgi:glycolate oxidase FAD binding subunit